MLQLKIKKTSIKCRLNDIFVQFVVMIYFCNIFFTLFTFLLPLFIIMLSPFPSFSLLLLLILLLHVYVPIKNVFVMCNVKLGTHYATCIQNKICNLSNRVQKSIHIHFYPSFFSQKNIYKKILSIS